MSLLIILFVAQTWIIEVFQVIPDKRSYILFPSGLFNLTSKSAALIALHKIQHWAFHHGIGSLALVGSLRSGYHPLVFSKFTTALQKRLVTCIYKNFIQI